MSVSLVHGAEQPPGEGAGPSSQRQYQRYLSKRDLTATVDLDGVSAPALVSNISCGGCALVVLRPHAVEDGDSLKITLGDLPERTATTRWHVRASQRVLEIGVQFDPGEDLQLEELQQIGCMTELSVLIVESSRVIRRVCVEACESRGLRAVTVSNTAEALMALEEGRFDAVLTAHHHRAGLPGTSLIAALVQSPRHRGMQTALLTSDSELLGAEEAPPGVDQVISKSSLDHGLMLFLRNLGAGQGGLPPSIRSSA